ncbi:hypothetical protein [Flavonifractor sp. An82]|uniref:hypothetical protein n=1 Tax=Flavonifractor sp. An82 TaxID=1965660 RepID=UPI000B395820|nr:hypothetical protein [Flavonifractor sp. An82]
MNNKRRKEIAKCIEMLSKKSPEIRNALEDLNDILFEEDEYRDNMPENLQGGSRYEDSEEASDLLNEAISYLDDALDEDDSDAKLELVESAIGALNNIN